ncbi:GNAT superfamily N-acetyltransferase [Bradyrhizobium sp. AZCC 1721]
MYLTVIAAALADSSVRTLSQQEELPLLRDHLLRLDRTSRRDRFHGFMDDSFIERYAEKCANDGTTIIAFFENGVVRGAAELHPPDQSPDSLPEIAFSVETSVRRRGVGSILFRKLIKEARAKAIRACGSPPARRTRRCGRSPASSAHSLYSATANPPARSI